MRPSSSHDSTLITAAAALIERATNHESHAVAAAMHTVSRHMESG